MRYISILILSCLIYTSVSAQEKKEYDWKTNLAVADDLYRRNSFYNAADFYKKVLNKDAEKYPNDRYYYALMLKQTGKCDDAIVQFDQYTSSDKKDNKLAARSVVEKQGCVYGSTLKPNADVK